MNRIGYIEAQKAQRRDFIRKFAKVNGSSPVAELEVSTENMPQEVKDKRLYSLLSVPTLKMQILKGNDNDFYGIDCDNAVFKLFYPSESPDFSSPLKMEEVNTDNMELGEIFSAHLTDEEKDFISAFAGEIKISNAETIVEKFNCIYRGKIVDDDVIVEKIQKDDHNSSQSEDFWVLVYAEEYGVGYFKI